MIKLLRIDDRLIHGQVAVYWVNATGADTIVIANDKHASNPRFIHYAEHADRSQSDGLS